MATAGRGGEHAELTALACVMMLERVNYLISIGVRLPADEMTDRLSDVIYAAFHSAQPTGLRSQPAQQPAP
jgi:hypothetical protein